MLLVPYTIVIQPTEFSTANGEIFLWFRTPSYTTPYPYTYIRLDKEIAIDEPYELHLEARVSDTRGVYGVTYSGVNVGANDTSYRDVYRTISIGTGKMSLGIVGSFPDNSGGQKIWIKNLYLKRVRE